MTVNSTQEHLAVTWSSVWSFKGQGRGQAAGLPGAGAGSAEERRVSPGQQSLLQQHCVQADLLTAPGALKLKIVILTAT